LTTHRVRILCYHGVWDGSDRFPGDALFITPTRFRRHLDLIQAGGYSVISLDEAVKGLKGKCQLPPSPIVITIDDGWHSTFVDMWPELRCRSMPATLYVDTGTLLSGKPVPHVMARYLIAEYGAEWETHREALARTLPKIGGPTLEERLLAAAEVVSALGIDLSALHAERRFEYMTPDELHACFREGLEVQLHTRTHLLVEKTSDEVEREVRLNRNDLSQILRTTSERFRHFCYPSGVHDPAMYEGLCRAHVVSATTTQLGLAHSSSNPYALPRLLMGEMHSDIEFQAELSGVMDVLRFVRRQITRSRRTQ
jgi:peptidoglycan/xylan/chitin deacetylase (PgdA/CDA1 family)